MNDPFAFVIVMTHIAAVLALFNGFITPILQSRVAITSIESIARQPEAANSISGSMLVALAMCETSGIYGLLIAIIMLFANPLVNLYVQHAVK